MIPIPARNVLLGVLIASAMPAFAAAEPPASVPPAPAATAKAAPVLRFSPEVLDLGEFSVGRSKTATLTVTNSSAQSITIESVKAGCGCTKLSELPKGPVAAGASFTLEVTLDPGTKPGIDLVKAVHFTLAGGSVESMQIKGRVKAAQPGDPAVPPASDLVVMFRLPASSLDEARRASIEREQDALIAAIDRGMSASARSPGFRMRLHRESGMLFVHGTNEDVDAVRESVRALPAPGRVRESGSAPSA